MKNFIEYDLGDGSTILVEGGIEKDDTVYRGEEKENKIVKTASRTFSQALDQITPVADIFTEKINAQKNKPDEFTVEFGLKLGAEAKIVVANASAEANFKIVIKWKNNN